MVPCDLKLGVERETVLLMRLVRLQGLFTAVFASPLAERRQKQFSAFLKTCSVCRREVSLCSFAKKKNPHEPWALFSVEGGLWGSAPEAP